MNRSVGFVEIDGKKIYYECAGDGFPVVFLHAGLADCRMWDEQFEFLAGQFRVYRYDARGFGQSALPGESFFPVEDLRRLLDLLEVDCAALVGASMGGGVALEFALRYPHRVRSLVLVGATLYGYSYSPEFMRKGSEVFVMVREKGPALFMRYFLNDSFWSFTVPGGAFPSARRRFEELLRANARMFDWFPNYIRCSDIPTRSRLHEVKAPSFVVVGDHDHPDNISVAEILHKRIPNSRFRVVSGSGHMLNMEQPEIFNGLIMQFLTTAAAG